VPGFARLLSSAEQDGPINAALYFRPKLDWDDLSRRLHAPDTIAKRKAQADLRAAIVEQREPIAEKLTAIGLKVRSMGTSVPVLFVGGTVSAMRKVAQVDEIRFAMSVGKLKGELRSSPDAQCTSAGHADPIGLHEVDSAFNETTPSYYGATRWDDIEDEVVVDPQRIGIVEDVGDCTLNAGHEAFDFINNNDFVYSNTSPENCVAAHGTMVASVMSGSTNAVKRGAAQARFVYPNVGTQNEDWDNAPNHPPSVQCEPAATLDAYDWMVTSEGVNTVNESFGCIHEDIACNYLHASGWEGVIQDYFARQFDVAIVKAAGNDNCSVDQEACPWSLNSLCVGAVDSSFELSCFSSATDPGEGGSSIPTTDREEPDLVAVGGQSLECAGPMDEDVCGAATGSSTAWAGAYGTSFSAPIVTAMLALFREKCEPVWEREFDQRFLRAVAKTASWGADPADYAYSTSTPTSDWKDGAGVLLSPQLLEFCAPGADAGAGSTVIDLTGEESGEMPSGSFDYQQTWDPPGQTESYPLDFIFEPGPGQGFEWYIIAEFEDLLPETRIRATWSWDGCGDEFPSNAPAGVATDFDLFLFNETTGDYVWASQSESDSNEGFDYTLQSGQGGDYQLIAAWVPGQNCDGGSTEPAAYAWRIWAP
jgi:hypothetical protein